MKRLYKIFDKKKLKEYSNSEYFSCDDFNEACKTARLLHEEINTKHKWYKKNKKQID